MTEQQTNTDPILKPREVEYETSAQEEYRVNKQGILERYYEGQWVEDTSR